MDVASPTPENQCLDGHSNTFMLTPNKDGQDICELAQGIHQALPQTQCRRCGEQDCFAYAQAIAQRKAPINRCPPGGKEGMVRIAQAMGQPGLAQGLEIDPVCGSEGSMAVAVIDENGCIGCTFCIRACPTDAIVGSRRHMHSVLPAYCTGCELCVLACPVDCIVMNQTSGGISGDATRTGWKAWSQPQANQALLRYTQHQLRLQRNRNEQRARCADEDASMVEPDTTEVSEETVLATQDRKRSVIEAALARARRGRQLQD